MAWTRRPTTILLTLVLITDGGAAERSRAARAAFLRAHPCPATGLSTGACPGWVVDHVTPLCAGGADAPTNMQWQTAADAKRKDVDERRLCRRAAGLGLDPERRGQ